jgi:hypothetical protein
MATFGGWSQLWLTTRLGPTLGGWQNFSKTTQNNKKISDGISRGDNYEDIMSLHSSERSVSHIRAAQQRHSGGAGPSPAMPVQVPTM